MRISDWSSDVCSSDLNISIGGSVYRRDLNSFNFIDNDRRTTFEQVTTGAQINVGVPLTEFMSFFGRYSINFDDVKLDRRIYYFGDECDPLVAAAICATPSAIARPRCSAIRSPMTTATNAFVRRAARPCP